MLEITVDPSGGTNSMPLDGIKQTHTSSNIDMKVHVNAAACLTVL